MTIELDKILTISATEWCKSEGRNLKDFKLVGVRAMEIVNGIERQIENQKHDDKDDDDEQYVYEYEYNEDDDKYDESPPILINPKKELAKKVPTDAEIVVDYRVNFGGIVKVIGFYFNKRETIDTVYEANATALIPKEKDKDIGKG